MIKCDRCNVEMKEDADIHTDYVGGYSFDEQIFITYEAGNITTKNIFGKEQEKEKYESKQVKCRFCPQCGKVELFIDLNSQE